MSPFCDPRSIKSSRTAPESAIRGIISSKNPLESAIRGGRSSKNEARDGYIGNLRRHEGSKSAKYSKTNGKSIKMRLVRRM